MDTHPILLINDFINKKITFFYYFNSRWNRVDCHYDPNLLEYLTTQLHIPFSTLEEALKIAYPDTISSSIIPPDDYCDDYYDDYTILQRRFNEEIGRPENTQDFI